MKFIPERDQVKPDLTILDIRPLEAVGGTR